MIDLSKAYKKAKNFMAKNDEYNNCGVYFYVELNKVYAFFTGKDKNNCFDKKVITVNKEGGKVNQFTIRQLSNYFYEYDYENLMEINNPDILGDFVKVNNPVENVEDILDFNFKKEITRRDFLFNLTEEGETCRTIEKIINSGITLDNILKMDLEGFAKAYGVRKKELYFKISELSQKNLTNNDLPISALFSRGVSAQIINRLVELGIDKCYKLYLIPREIFPTKFSMLDATVDKIYEAFDEMNFILTHDKNTSLFANSLTDDVNYRKMVKSEIHRITSASNVDMKPLIIKSKLDSKYSQLTCINELINEMIAEKIITLTGTGLKANSIRLKDYLDYLPDNQNNRIAKAYYLDVDSTYDTIGKKLNVTRERIRQLVEKVIIPNVYEDKYVGYLEKYDFNKSSFAFFFDEEEYVFKYLDRKFKPKGSIKLSEMLDDEGLEEKLKKKAEEYFENKYLIIDGTRLYKTKVALLKYYMRENVRKLTPIEDICEGFNLFIKENVSDLDDVSFDSSYQIRDIESPIMADRFPALKTNNRKYKYYDIHSTEIKQLIDAMDLEQYTDIEISSKYLFDLHFDLMVEYDIDDQYVLHNLFKKTYKKDDVDYQRSPYIVFGKGDRKKQIDNLILENAPISTQNLSELYCSIYGGNVSSVKTFIETEFKELINHQMIDLDYKTLDLETINKFKYLLCSRVFWFKEDIFELCDKNNIEIPTNLFSWQNMEKIGFKNASNYITSTKYESAKEYFEQEYFSKDFLDTTTMDRRLTYIVVFSGMIIEKRKNLELIEFEKGKFMKSNLLNKANVGLEELKDFIKSVEIFTYNKGPFTIKSIRNEGYYHELFELGFEDVFYSSILRGSDILGFKRYGRETLFENNNKGKEVLISDVVERILFTYRKMEEYDLIEYIEENYGMNYQNELNNFREFIKKTNIYYDKYTDIYYYDYETYYEEM